MKKENLIDGRWYHIYDEWYGRYNKKETNRKYSKNSVYIWLSQYYDKERNIFSSKDEGCIGIKECTRLATKKELKGFLPKNHLDLNFETIYELW